MVDCTSDLYLQVHGTVNCSPHVSFQQLEVSTRSSMRPSGLTPAGPHPLHVSREPYPLSRYNIAFLFAFSGGVRFATRKRILNFTNVCSDAPSSVTSWSCSCKPQTGNSSNAAVLGDLCRCIPTGSVGMVRDDGAVAAVCMLCWIRGRPLWVT